MASVTIANGASLSDTLSLTAGRAPVGVIMPSAWTAAALTFQGSNDGTTFVDLHRSSDGAEISLTVAANRWVLFDADLIAQFAGVLHIKLRSGTSGTPVNQGGARVLTIVQGRPRR